MDQKKFIVARRAPVKPLRKTGMNELCFVWGPPLSGQMRWMDRAAEMSDSTIRTHLIPVLNNETLNDQLNQLNQVLADCQKSAISVHHIYCELPWSATMEDIEIEAWLQGRPEFQMPGATFQLSFVCLCPQNADELPFVYREGLEEFSRSSRSAVIVVRDSDDPSIPKWLDEKTIDFGRTIEVFDENIWDRSGEAIGRSEMPDLDPETHSEFMTLTFSLEAKNSFHLELFRDFASGEYGSIWGAEAIWSKSQFETEVLTYASGSLHSWTTKHSGIATRIPASGGLLTVSGFLSQDLLTKALRSQQFS